MPVLAPIVNDSPSVRLVDASAAVPMTVVVKAPQSVSKPLDSDHPWSLLAGLRFLLALIVLGAHAPVASFHCAPLEWMATLGPQQAIIAFFLISGYSIGHSVQKEPVGYYKRRFFRIYPVYLSCLATGMLPYIWNKEWVIVGNGPIGLAPLSRSLLPSLLLAQCFGWPVAGVLGTSWTLSIEWLFYLLAPLIARARSILIAGIIVISAAAMLIYPHVPSISQMPYRSLPYGLPVLIAGWAWLAGFLLYRGRGDMRVKLAVLLVAVFVSLASADRYFMKPGVFVVALAIAVLCLGNRLRIPRRCGDFLRYLGDLSYPIYMLHLPIYILIYNRWHSSSWPVYLGATFALSAIILHFIDRPLRALGRSGPRESRDVSSCKLDSAKQFLNA